MAEHLLDTSFLIDLLNSDEDALEVHENTKGEQATSTVCVYELNKYEGFDATEFETKRVLPFTLEDAERAGEVHRALREAGEPVGETDSMISGVALNRGLRLVTRDEDFRKVQGLETLYYPADL